MPNFHYEDILEGRVNKLSFVKTSKPKRPYDEEVKKKKPKKDYSQERARKRGEL